jgi:ATP-dependent protease HslVU (ClpYQ) peptidase subunit
MTAIAGVEHDGLVVIGGDSAGVAGYRLQARADEKVFRNGPMIFGFCGSFRLGQLIRYALTVPRRHPDDLVDKWLTVEFVDAVRAVLKDKGNAQREKEQEAADGSFLLGYEGHLFVIYGDYQVARPRHGFAAVGCGEELVLGALHATAGTTLTARQRVEAALQAAAEFSAGVRPPFTILTLPDTTTEPPPPERSEGDC